MRHILFLLPLLAAIGCETKQTTPPAKASATPTSKPDRAAAASPSSSLTQSASQSTPAGPQEKNPPSRPPEFEDRKEDPPEAAPPIPEAYKPLNKDKTIFFEKKADGGKLVHLKAEVCLREGPLEVFLCKNNTKEHESIVRIDADARDIHLALIAAGAEAGSPVKFVPKYQGATGTKIKVSVTYNLKGKLKTSAAGEWIKDRKTGKDMAYDWVFAGSRLFQDPERPNVQPFYLANNGELISVANFPDSMLDLPVKSSKDVDDLHFEIHTERIPPLRTPVIVTLEPVIEKKKK